MILNKKIKIGIIGLGYVGLPLLCEFYKKFFTVGFDISNTRIKELKGGIDKTKETNINDLINIKDKVFENINYLKTVNFFIVTVPTPVNKKNIPDLSLLKNACNIVASVLKKGDIVVFESTGYPGLTEEICAPILENKSLLSFNKDFYVGYSPERVNPGDKSKKLKNIKKIISGSKKSATTIIKNVYKKIIKAGVHEVSSIKVAEAAKVIENTQRDLNIALINELSQIFKKININTRDVLDAASTKWNFMKFYPGLVGGHCIGVDPYYLTHMCKNIGFRPQVILAGRKINDDMPLYVVNRFLQNLKRNKLKFSNCRILVAGLSFKENVTDIRNSKSIEIIKILKKNNLKLDIYDPLVPNEILDNQIIIKDLKKLKKNYFDAIMILVPHSIIISELSQNLNILKKSKKTIIFDIKNSLTGIKSNFTL
jgi:UDP-N-acetyl-D-galactosamine dehydrogenase